MKSIVGLMLLSVLVILNASTPILFAEEPGQSESQELRLGDFLSQLKGAEERLSDLNLEVQAELVLEQLDEGNLVWLETPQQSRGSVWFMPGTSPQFRMDYEVTRVWYDGLHDYSTEDCTVIYDGRKIVYAQHAIGSPEELSEYRRAQITDRSPASAGIGLDIELAGITYTNAYWGFDRKQIEAFSLSQEMGESLATGTEIRLDRGEWEGQPCIVISVGSGRVREEIGVDPNRGYAVLGNRVFKILPDGTEQHLRRTDVLSLEEIAPDVWYPTEVTAETGLIPSLKTDEMRFERKHYVAFSVSVAETKEQREALEYTFPPHYYVTDDRFDIRYETTGEPKVLQDELDQMVEVIRQTTQH